MEALEAIRTRRSIRKYKPESIPKDQVNKILEAGRWAPSANNSQPWKFIVVDEPGLLQKLAEAAQSKLLGMNGFVKHATVLLVIIRENPNFTSKIGGQIKNKDY